MQIEFLPEFKVHPFLSHLLDSGPGLQWIKTLAVSFPLIHSCTSPVCNGSELPPEFDPGEAAAHEWPEEMLLYGISATVNRINQYHVRISTHNGLQVSIRNIC